jgi:hypothetical protein
MIERAPNRLSLFGCLLVASCGGQNASAASSPQGNKLQLVSPAPQPEIAISPPDESGTFHFAFCGKWTSEPPQIRKVFVSRLGVMLGPALRASDFECIWKKASGAPLSTEWRYGSAPRGSSTIGECAPLAVGTHVITVSGIGLGSLEFRVNEQGVGTAVTETCTRHSPD